ncbi:unnamed protein product, partial [Prunus brigantina]
IGIEAKINKAARSLTDFNGATLITVGTVELDVYSPPVIIYEVSPYNDILGRPWIGKINVIGSATHKKIHYLILGGGVSQINNNQIMCHQLHVNLASRLVAHKRHNFSPKRVAIIEAKIDKLLAVGFIVEVSYLEWLANVVLVAKKDQGK